MPKAIWHLTATLADADGDKSPASVYFSTGEQADETLLTFYAARFWDAVRPLVVGQLVGLKISLEADLSLFTNNPYDVTADVQEKAVFGVTTFDGRQRPIRITLPTVNEQIFINDGAGKHVDFTNSDVQFFATVLEQNIDEFGFDACDSHGNDLNRVITGEQGF
jgi:hypothetical protein